MPRAQHGGGGGGKGRVKRDITKVRTFRSVVPGRREEVLGASRPPGGSGPSCLPGLSFLGWPSFPPTRHTSPLSLLAFMRELRWGGAVELGFLG